MTEVATLPSREYRPTREADDAAERRRGWCPGVRRPMPTGDGLLARLHPPGGRLTAAQAEGVAAAASSCGNGEIEVTARGNLQLRGVRDADELASRMDALGLLEPETRGPLRLTVLSPLAGLDPAEAFDAAALAAAIEAAGRGIAGLPVKTAVVVDGGGRVPLDEVEADIHLVADGSGRVAVALATDTGPVRIGSVPVGDVTRIARAMLEAFAALADGSGRQVRRVRDLAPAGLARLVAAVGVARPPTPPPERKPTPRAGLLDTTEGRNAVLVGLPFGRCDAAQLAELSGIARREASGELRVSFTRGILIPGCRASTLPATLDAIGRLGLILDPDDPRLSVSACPGRPACASGWAPAAADAALLAAAARVLLANGATLHVSGCPKGCAHPRAADLTLVGQPEGGYGIVLGGTSRDPVGLRLPAAAIAARLAALAGPADVASAFGVRT